MVGAHRASRSGTQADTPVRDGIHLAWVGAVPGM